MTFRLSLHVPGLSAARYDELVRELVAREDWPPAERLEHTATEGPAGLDIVETWASRAAADGFIARIFAVLDREDVRVVVT